MFTCLIMVRSCSVLHIYNQVLPLENKARERRWYGQTFGVLDLSMTLVVVAYITFGFYGYVEFGDKVSASVILDIKGR